MFFNKRFNIFLLTDDVWTGFVWNGLWVLELAAVGDSRVSINGDVKLELTSFRPRDSRFDRAFSYLYYVVVL